MDVTAIFELIGSYAFPIVACIAIFKKLSDDSKAYREESARMAEAYRSELRTMADIHRAETEKLSEAVQNNTIAVNQLVDHLREVGKDGRELSS